MYLYLPIAAPKLAVFTLVVHALAVNVNESVEVSYLIELPVDAVFPAKVMVDGPTAPHT